MAGTASRIFNFCNRQPIPCKCFNTCPPIPGPIPNTKVEDYLILNNASSGAPFSVCNYGNAFTGSETFAGEGDGRVNTPVNKNMYFRYASMTKFMGMVVLGAALEDGYISSLDDPIANYIDEFNGNGTYINPTSVTNTGNFNSYGSPTYTFDTIDFSLNTITIRHLVNGTAGFGYSFLGTGILRSILNELPNPSTNTLCNRNTFIAWLQYIENNPQIGKADLLDSFYSNPNDNSFEETFTNHY